MINCATPAPDRHRVWPLKTGTCITTPFNHRFKVPLGSPLYVELVVKTSFGTFLRRNFEFRAGAGLSPRNEAGRFWYQSIKHTRHRYSVGALWPIINHTETHIVIEVGEWSGLEPNCVSRAGEFAENLVATTPLSKGRVPSTAWPNL
jgi:hypothetical protein